MLGETKDGEAPGFLHPPQSVRITRRGLNPIPGASSSQ